MVYGPVYRKIVNCILTAEKNCSPFLLSPSLSNSISQTSQVLCSDREIPTNNNKIISDQPACQIMSSAHLRPVVKLKYH